MGLQYVVAKRIFGFDKDKNVKYVAKSKPLSTGICFAAQLDGRGRLLENVMGEVGCLGLDYDHLSSGTRSGLIRTTSL